MSGNLSRRPLTASQHDQDLYVSTPVLDQAAAALRIGTNLFITGPAGSGKTTLARHIEAEADAAVVVSAEQHRTATDLINGMLIEIARDDNAAHSNVDSEMDVHRIGTALERRAAQDGPIDVIILDGASEEQTVALFGRFRDAIWELPVQWVVTSRGRPKPPADAFFDRVIHLERWPECKLTELLERRAPDVEASWTSRLVQQIAPAHPAEAILAFQTLLMQPQHSAEQVLEIFYKESQRLAALPPRLRDVYVAVRRLGPISASDEQLLDAVGVSRSRLTHNLKELGELGLLIPQREGKRVLYNTISKDLLLET